MKCSLTTWFSPPAVEFLSHRAPSPQSGAPWRPTRLLLLRLIAHTKLTEVNGGLCSAQNSHALAIQRSSKTALNPFITRPGNYLLVFTEIIFIALLLLLFTWPEKEPGYILLISEYLWLQIPYPIFRIYKLPSLVYYLCYNTHIKILHINDILQ